jgi:diguanylate cyclase (GGDEF)-like protein
MISLKKYLDSNSPAVVAEQPDPNGQPAAAIDIYRALLLALGKTALQISPGLGVDIEASLRGFERRLSVGYTAESLQKTEKQVEVQLQEWGSRTAEHFKTQADDVKELLVALAKTAESVGSRDQNYSTKFKSLTGRLERIADFNDLKQMRSSLVQRVLELKECADQMAIDNRQLVAQLQAEVSTYETRLRSVEHLALKDPLTGLANRRSVEDRIQWNISNTQEFCIVMLDLNRFKPVNDVHGHQAGDDLLKQFAMELQLNTRTGDMVGRWGGDEFIVVLSCTAELARAHLARMREWVFGKYTLRLAGRETVTVEMDASVGVVEWQPGQTMQELVDEADKAMYREKALSRQGR